MSTTSTIRSVPSQGAAESRAEELLEPSGEFTNDPVHHVPFLQCEGVIVGEGDGEAEGGAGASPGDGLGPRGCPVVSSVADSLEAFVRAVVAGMTVKRNQVSFSPSALRVAHPLTLRVLSEPTIFRPSTATRPDTPVRTITSFLNFPKEPKLFESLVLKLAHVIFTLHRKFGFAPPALS